MLLPFDIISYHNNFFLPLIAHYNVVIQIYNVEKRIGEDNLQHLALFSEYGRMALASNTDTETDTGTNTGDGDSDSNTSANTNNHENNLSAISSVKIYQLLYIKIIML